MSDVTNVANSQRSSLDDIPVRTSRGADGAKIQHFIETPEGGYITRIDEASSTVTYIGKAVPGTATSAASWLIQKIDTSSGTSILFAGGASTFDQVWNNRASLSYS